MVYGNPRLNSAQQRLGFGQYLSRLCLTRNLSSIVVDSFSLAPALIQVQACLRGALTEDVRESFYRDPVVILPGCPVAGARKRHSGDLQSGVVRRYESSICRNRLHGGICKIARYDRS